jgi:hypothetical protein
MLGEVHLAHPARAQLAQDRVSGEDLTVGQRHGRIVSAAGGLPSTLRGNALRVPKTTRRDAKAQRTFAKATHDAAVKEYGSPRRRHLMDIARRLHISGRTSMDKSELVAVDR